MNAMAQKLSCRFLFSLLSTKQSALTSANVTTGLFGVANLSSSEEIMSMAATWQSVDAYQMDTPLFEMNFE